MDIICFGFSVRTAGTGDSERNGIVTRVIVSMRWILLTGMRSAVAKVPVVGIDGTGRLVGSAVNAVTGAAGPVTWI